jgi:hypothetical protein
MPMLRRLFQPTLSDLLGLLLLILVIVSGSRRLFGDADVATHVATGRWILDHRSIPTTDPFPGPFHGHEWFAHEWLTDLLMAAVHAGAGWPGIVWLSAFLIAAAHVILYRHLLRRGDDALAAFGATMAAAAAASMHWLARPHLVTVLFLVIWAAVLEGVARGALPPRRLFLLPPLALLWTNLHGGFLMAPVILACYGAGVVLQEARGGGSRLLPRRLAPWTIAALLTAGAVLVNPWGYRLPLHEIAYIALHGEAIGHTAEFESPNLMDRAGMATAGFLLLCLAGLALGLIAAVRAQRRGGPHWTTRFHPGTLLAFLGTVAMALRSIRHVELMVIFGAILLADGVSIGIAPKVPRDVRALLEPLRRRERQAGGGLFLAGLLIAALLAVSGRFPESGFDASLFPVKQVRKLRDMGVRPAGPVFTPDVWGGYLLLEWPEAPVLVDGRWDMRGDAFYLRYADTLGAGPGWERNLAEDRVDWVLLPPEAPLAPALRSSPEWDFRGGDATAEVFQRKPEAAGSDSR